MRNKGLRETVLDYLKRHYTMTLATARDNKPWAATVFYANDGFDLYFMSSPTIAWHSQNIADNPYVSVTVDEDYPLRERDDWKKVKGVQLEGKAEMLISEEDVTKAVEVYAGKYPFVAPYLKLIIHYPRVTSFLEKITDKLLFVPSFKTVTENRFYRVTPMQVWFVDNEVSFERRLEVSI